MMQQEFFLQLHKMTEKAKSRKRNSLDDKVLAKARQYVVEPDSHSTTSEIHNILNPPSDEPPLKKQRKPRHAEKKPKQTAEIVASAESPEKKKGKKKKKKSKKRTSSGKEKDPESIERHNSDALGFLEKWKESRSEWKFEKLKQTWLLKNCLDPELIPDDSFQLLLEYMGSVKGQARVATGNDMAVALKAFEMKQNPSEIDKQRCERARQTIQMLSDD